MTHHRPNAGLRPCPCADCVAAGYVNVEPFTRSERIAQALRFNGLTWASPIVDIIDALIYDGGFTAAEADAIAVRNVR
jgi:hypothetical protein